MNNVSPAPVGPTIAVVVPAGTEKVTPFNPWIWSE